jgi:hypothetical protein
LLVGGRDEPSFMRTLAGELPSADRVDAIVAFVKWSGLRLLLEPLDALLRRDVPLRLLTTTCMGVTERRALDFSMTAAPRSASHTTTARPGCTPSRGCCTATRATPRRWTPLGTR